MIVIIAFSLCALLIFATEVIPYIYKLSMMGKVRIYKYDDGFAVKQFGYSTYNNIRYYYDSSNYYGWYWITRHKQPTCSPERLSQTEAEELAQSLHDDYMNYIVAEHKFYLKTKSKEKTIKSAKLFKKL
jgi:hypothetical protein